MNPTKELDISKELKNLRLALTPVLSDHYKGVLKEAEKRLTGEVCPSTSPGKIKRAKEKWPTKKELYYQLFNK